MSRIENEIKKTIKLAEKIDITKLDGSFIKKVTSCNDFDKLDKETMTDLISLASLICTARNKGSFTENEVMKATNELIISITLESLVRKGLLERKGKWKYKNSKDCYRATELGKSYFDKI